MRHLLPLLAGLRDSGCERDSAGNRQLYFDEYVTLVLLCLTNPLLDSVRALQQASELEKITAQLGVRRFSLGSFSESVQIHAPGPGWDWSEAAAVAVTMTNVGGCEIKLGVRVSIDSASAKTRYA